MNHEQHLQLADHAVRRAERLAGHAESAAHSSGGRDNAEPFAAVAAVWADIARTHTAIAAELPATVEESADA